VIVELKSVLFSKDHIIKPFTIDNNGMQISIADKKTKIIALSIFVGIFTAGIGGVVFFYCLAAKYKINKLNEVEKIALDALVEKVVFSCINLRALIIKTNKIPGSEINQIVTPESTQFQFLIEAIAKDIEEALPEEFPNLKISIEEIKQKVSEAISALSQKNRVLIERRH
jgi:hypothetical protein